jgi:hypothetical protein
MPPLLNNERAKSVELPPKPSTIVSRGPEREDHRTQVFLEVIIGSCTLGSFSEKCRGEGITAA